MWDRVALVLSFVAGCGPSTGEDDRRTCGGTEPVRLIGAPHIDPGDQYVTGYVAGAHVLAQVLGLDSAEQATYAAFAIDECGQQVVELVPRSSSMRTMAGVAGRWMFAVDDETREVTWMDPTGHQPSRVVFEDAHSCALPVGGGLAIQDADGTMWFHPDPADANAAAAPVMEGLFSADHPASFFGDLNDCWLPAGDIPVVDGGDALLTAKREGSLVRIDVVDGDVETIVDEPVGQFVVLEDPRYILWRGGSTYGPPDCCDLQVRDRVEGDDVDVGGSVLPGTVAYAGLWVASWVSDFGGTSATDFVDVETGTRLRVPGGWQLEARLSDTHLLLTRFSAADDDGTHVLDVTTGLIESLDFPPPTWGRPRFSDGIVGFQRGVDGYRGTLLLLRFEDLEIEVLAHDVDPLYARTQSGAIVYIERADEDAETGTLVLLTRDGERHTIDTDVYGFQIPFHGTDREVEEVLYGVRDELRGGLWRFVIP